jgi:hypothetical protein
MFDTIQLFITFRCSGDCPYCIQGKIKRNVYTEVSTDKWIDLIKGHQHGTKIGLIGGEPTVYKGFKDIIEQCANDYVLTVTTNLKSKLFEDFNSFLLWASKYKVRWNMSFHPSVLSVNDFVNKVTLMRLHGLWVDQVASVDCEEVRKYHKELCDSNIGFWLQIDTSIDDKGVLHPTKEELHTYGSGETGIYDYKEYSFLCDGVKKKIDVFCMTKKLLVNPEGEVFRCHRDIYSRENSIGNIFDRNVTPNYICPNLGTCNPCDYNSIKYWEV